MHRWMMNSASALPKLRLLALMPIFLPLAGCAILGRGTEVHWLDTSCSAFRPITYSGRDTAETVAEVRAHNRVYDRLCPAAGGGAQ